MTRLAFQRIGKPVFEATLGKVVAEGGAGVVQEATRADAGAQTVIVKRARAGGEALLEYERRTCENLDHPSLVRYLGSASAPGLGPLLAFEALAPNPLLAFNGQTMRPTWRDPRTPYFPLPPGRAIELAFDLLLALEHLHDHGLVHADVKLSNLLARVPEKRDPGSLLAAVADGRFTGVLIDLGSVRPLPVLDALSRGDADPTLIPSITPLYAPPEALMERSELGGRKLFSPVMDTYAFALVFYALLTGRIPYSHLMAADRLKDTETVLDLKSRETRGSLSPVDLRALTRIPLHDVGFESSALSIWPQFHATTRELLVRCLEPDPGKRIEAKEARAFFQDGYRIRLASEGARGWVQGIFQMLPRSNRLLRDAPKGGMRISEEKDGRVTVTDALPALPPAAAREQLSVEDGSTISYTKREAPRRTASGRLGKAPPPPKGMVYLADVLREFKAKRPLPVTAPVIVTRTSFAPTELVKCTLFSLEQARQKVKVSDSGDPLDEKGVVTVGRGEDNDIVLSEASVSKRHLALEKDDSGGWWVIDNGSSNGTFVDDVELQKNGKVRLTRGLVTIGLGKTAKLTFMQAEDLDHYLERALDMWAQAFGSKASGRHNRPSDGGTVIQREDRDRQVTEVTPPPNPRAPTRRHKRDELVPALPPAVPAQSTPGSRPRPMAASKEELAQKLSETKDVEVFAVHFDNARTEDCDTASEVLELLAGADEVLGVDAILNNNKKLVLYRKDPTQA